MRLKGKVAMVAGAGVGVGRATAILLADEGANVAVVSRRKEVVDHTISEILERGGRATAVVADLTKADRAEKALAHVIDKFGKIDILHCNTGSYSTSPIEEMSETDWDAMFDVNLKSNFLTVRASIPHFVKNGSGSIIMTAAIFGQEVTLKNMAHYNASKAGVVAFTKSLAVELAPHHIRVNCICPGQIPHRLYTQGHSQLKTNPKLQRSGYPEDIAFGVLYLATDESSWVTGTSLVIDGGASVGLENS